jgi:hypothetical protein
MMLSDRALYNRDGRVLYASANGPWCDVVLHVRTKRNRAGRRLVECVYAAYYNPGDTHTHSVTQVTPPTVSLVIQNDGYDTYYYT